MVRDDRRRLDPVAADLLDEVGEDRGGGGHLQRAAAGVPGPAAARGEEGSGEGGAHRGPATPVSAPWPEVCHWVNLLSEEAAAGRGV
ncbi:hypothetical protein GCM10027168_64880 [Streptomyces capparidis]